MKRLRDSDSTSKHRRQVRFHMARCKGEGPLQDKLHAEASLVYATGHVLGAGGAHGGLGGAVEHQELQRRFSSPISNCLPPTA